MTNNHHTHKSNLTQNIRTAFFLNLTFTFVEIVGGLLTNSVAILSDAIHDLGDSLSLGISWYFQKISQKKKNKNFTFGYRRFSIFGAIINSIVLIVGSIIIISEAIPRLITPVEPDTDGMIIIAILGILVNGAAVLQLNKGKSLNEKVVSWHLIEDVLGWAAVLIGAIVMTFIYLPILDPILSVLICLLIVVNTFRNLKTALNIILQGTPVDIDIQDLKTKLIDFKQITDIHDVHLWTMDGQYNILTVHLVLTENKDLEYLVRLKKEIREKLKDENIEHVTIEFESPEEKCIHLDC